MMLDQQNDGPEQSPTDEEVGYCKPPMCRRFKVCGNPKGRPPGSKNRKTIVREVANEMHSVRENGKWQRRSMLDLVLLRLRNMALECKNTRAFDEIHRLTKAYEPQVADGVGGYLVVPAAMTPEEWIAEQEKLNETRRPPPGYKSK